MSNKNNNNNIANTHGNGNANANANANANDNISHNNPQIDQIVAKSGSVRIVLKVESLADAEKILAAANALPETTTRIINEAEYMTLVRRHLQPDQSLPPTEFAVVDLVDSPTLFCNK
jgi:hypothetical protein